MINPQELRIGNTVKYTSLSGASEFVNINTYHLSDIVGAPLPKPKSVGEYSPIPITPDILKKFGMEFSDSDAGLHCEFEGLDLVKDAEGRIYLYSVQYQDYSCLSQPIQYLHQLQNLIYAINGDELKVSQ